MSNEKKLSTKVYKKLKQCRKTNNMRRRYATKSAITSFAHDTRCIKKLETAKEIHASGNNASKAAVCI